MKGLEELQADNERDDNERELAELRADTVKGLKWAYKGGGIDALHSLLKEAEVLTPLFNTFADGDRRVEEPIQ